MNEPTNHYVDHQRFQQWVNNFAYIGRMYRDLMNLENGPTPWPVEENTILPLSKSESLNKACKQRSLQLYDDIAFLADYERIKSSVILARALLENIGFTCILWRTLRDHCPPQTKKLNKDIDLLHMSSFAKNYTFNKTTPRSGQSWTPDALNKFKKAHPPPIRPNNMINALEEFIQDNIYKSYKESAAWSVYPALCEWDHPSQTSLVHANTDLGNAIPTTFGNFTTLSYCKYTVSWSMAQIRIAYEVDEKIHDRLQYWQQHTN